MNKCTLDTNCLLALLVPGRDEQRAKVEKVVSSHECHVSDLVFVEVEFVLSRVYELPRSVVADNLRALMNIENINCNRNLFSASLAVYEKVKSLSFVDICLSVQAGLNDATPLYTFDKKLANQHINAKLL